MPAVDELSNGADVVAIDKRTVAIRSKHPTDAPAPVYETHLKT